MRGSRASAGLDRPDGRHHLERVGVDLGLQEAVEEHEPVRARLVEAVGHLAERAEVRAELHGDRHADRLLDAAQDVDVALLDVAAGGARVAGEVVDVQLDRGRAGLLHRARVVDPAARRDAVQAADHRDRRRRPRRARAGSGSGAGRARPRRPPGSRRATRRRPRRRRRRRARSRPTRAAAAPRTASRGRRRRRPRRRAGARRRASARAARPRRRAGCAGAGPGSRSTGPSASSAPAATKSLRAAGRHLLVGVPALRDRLLGEAVQALGLGRVGARERAVTQLAARCTRPAGCAAAGSRAGTGFRPPRAPSGRSGPAASSRWPRRGAAGRARRACRCRARCSGCRRARATGRRRPRPRAARVSVCCGSAPIATRAT